MNKDWVAVILAFIISILFIAVVALGLAFPVKWCWNYVMPYLFDLKEISWGQAWCLMFICNSLIKSSYTTNSKKVKGDLE